MEKASFQNILKKVPDASFSYWSSRTSIRRRKNSKNNPIKLYFWIWLSFNIDWQRESWKLIYKKTVKNIKKSINSQELDFLIKWIDENFYKVSRNVTIKDVNSSSKLFMHLLFILPYVKNKIKTEEVNNIEWLIARILYNWTRSWYTNYCKKQVNIRLREDKFT